MYNNTAREIASDAIHGFLIALTLLALCIQEYQASGALPAAALPKTQGELQPGQTQGSSAP